MATATRTVLDAAQQGGRDLPATTIALNVHVAQHAGAVWHALTSAAGTAIWLGRGAVLAGRGEPFRCENGSAGVVHSYHPLEQLRLSWQDHPSSPASLIELDLTPLATGTRIRIWHEGIDPQQSAGLRGEWELRLRALAELING